MSNFESQNNHKKNERFYYGKKHQILDLPNLIEVQTNSYKWFLEEGLKELFEEINPITDFIGRDLELHFGEYSLDEPKIDEVTAKEKIGRAHV